MGVQRFVLGFASFVRGVAFVVSTPRVWPSATVPIALAAILSWILGAIGVLAVLPGKSTSQGPLAWLVDVLFILGVVVIACVVGFMLARPLSGPALESIAREMERHWGVRERPKTNFFSDMVTAAKSSLATLALLPVSVALWLGGLFIPPLAPVFALTNFALVGLGLAWDLCDYPLSIRGLTLGQRIAWFKAHGAAVLGFGVALSIVALVPFAFFLFLPAGVAGATSLLCELDHAEGAGRASFC